MKLLNNYIQIEPIVSDSFMASQRDTYEELGVVVAVADLVADIPIGVTVRFDSFMAKKFPREGETDKFDWFIHKDECVAYDN